MKKIGIFVLKALGFHAGGLRMQPDENSGALTVEDLILLDELFGED